MATLGPNRWHRGYMEAEARMLNPCAFCGASHWSDVACVDAWRAGHAEGTPRPAPKPAHTPEPWFLDRFGMAAPIGPRAAWTVADIEGAGDSGLVAHDVAIADAARIVACVNALAGINPEAVPELLAAVDALLERYIGEERAVMPPKIVALADARLALTKATGGITR